MLDEILFMQARLFRMFLEQTHLSPTEAEEVFTNQGIWTFIEDCYDALHLSSDECALADINQKLALQGVSW